ncbi:hypothetical protein F511_16339 [Dorcoceras hygrometricum]|uniref:Uncharacterized protein n=1 Tax=Dorcoceras hygrometricum TaxID=472368 RepID=A0A2Z7AG65_9LAMI|nr:hypothetical protein F511_16339 [Dorcoceras hygrometricum]
MPPRRRGRGRGQIPEEFEGQNDEMQHSIPSRGRARQIEVEVDELAARVDDMELVMARFQRMNPQTFNGDEPSSDAEPWFQHITGFFDHVRYNDERRLSLATFQLRRMMVPGNRITKQIGVQKGGLNELLRFFYFKTLLKTFRFSFICKLLSQQ